MKALSLIQPWATLVVAGVKARETRSWKTRHRGLLAIHASKGLPRDARDIAESPAFAAALSALGFEDVRDLPRGALLGCVELVDCVPTSAVPSEDHDPFGNYGPNRYAWIFKNPQRINPIECRGALSLWDCDLAALPGGRLVWAEELPTLITELYPHGQGINEDLEGQRLLFDERTAKADGLL